MLAMLRRIRHLPGSCGHRRCRRACRAAGLPDERSACRFRARRRCRPGASLGVAQRLHRHGARRGRGTGRGRRARPAGRSRRCRSHRARRRAAAVRVASTSTLQQVPHGVGVFLAVQPMQAHVARVRVSERCAVQRAFHPRHERLHGMRVGLGISRWRHQPAAQLAHGLFPGLRVFGDALGRHGVECDAARPVRGVVALAAVFAEEVPLFLDGVSGAGGCGRRGGGTRGRGALGMCASAAEHIDEGGCAGQFQDPCRHFHSLHCGYRSNAVPAGGVPATGGLASFMSRRNKASVSGRGGNLWRPK